jgi:hypothetical protein
MPGRSLRPGELGVATRSQTERGRLAYVFIDRVRNAALTYRVDHVSVLAHAIAHEVGHLLLPSGAHSESGLMRAEWTRSDFRVMSGPGLAFTTDEASAIRARLLTSG